MTEKKWSMKEEDQEVQIHSMRDAAEKNLADPPVLKRQEPEDQPAIFPEVRQGWLKMDISKKICLSLIPISLLLIAILAALNITTVYEVPLVLPLMNTLFLGIIPIVIAYITFKVFLKNGSASVLLIGSGILLFGLGSIVAGWVNPLSGGPNMTVTLHNTCACIGSILILAGAVMSHTPAKSGRTTGNTGTIAAAYTAIVVFVTIFSLATLQGMIPPFFIPGSGPTVLRQVILENATALFALSSVLFMVTYRKGRSDFFFWYSVALALIAIGLLAVFVQPSVGSLIGWVGRTAQYIGFVFALYAVLIVRKTATAKGLPVEDVIGSFFVDAEQNYRQLVETTTDAIVTIDDNYRVLLWNSAAERMFGYPRDDAFGASFLKLVIDDPYIAVIKNYEQDIFGRDIQALTPEPVEIVGKRKGGALFPVELTMSRRWQEGRLIHTCILRDITERKKTEDALKQAHDNLEIKVRERTAQLSDANRDLLADITKRKKTEEDLRESEAFNRNLLENLPDYILIYDQTGTILYTNPLFPKQFGFTTEEAVGSHIIDHIAPEYRDQILTLMKQRTSDTVIPPYETSILKKDGSEVPVIVKGTPITFQGRDAVLILMNDISEHKRMEMILRESEELFAKSFYSGPLMMTISDIDSGRYLEVNDTFARVSGFSRNETIGKTSVELGWICQEDRAGLLEEITRTRKVTGKELRLTKKSGERVWCLFFAEIISVSGKERLLSLAENITERKLAEDALLKSQHFISSILESTPNLIYIYDLDEHCNVYTNREIVDYLGYSSEQILKFGPALFENILHPDDAQTVFQHHARLKKAHDGEVMECEYRMKHADGTWRVLRSRDVAFLRNQTSDVRQILGSVEDYTERKQIFEALQESENRFRMIFENSPLGMTLVTPDFHFFEANPGWISMTGYSEEELRNLTFKDITHPDHLAGDNEHMQDLVAGKIPFYATEKRYIRKDGGIIWGLINVTPIRDNDGRLLYFATQIENITERKQAEQALREAHDRFEATIASLNEAIFLVDPVTRLITECNDATTRIFGYSHEELVGRQTGFLHVDPAHLEQFGREASATYDDPGYYTREFEMRRKDGSVFPTEHFVRPIRDPDGRILYVVSVVRDITERKVAEVALKESETSYRGLFNTLRQAIYIIGADGKFIDVNEGAVAMYGYSRAEFIGRTTAFLAAPGRNDPSAMMEYIRKAFAGESQSFEFWAMRKGGEYFPKDVFFYKGTYFGKDVVIAICSDITKRKEAEEALRESEAHLRQITDTITSVFYIHDRVSNKFISVSPAYEQIWKRSCQSLIDNPYSFLEAVHPDDLPRVQESIRKELEEGKYVDTDYRIIQPDGNVHWVRSRNFPIVDETGKTFRVAGVAEDITDLKSADLSLKAAKEYAETLIQTANAMIIGLDSHGTINLFNEAAEGITGYTAAELAGRNWFEVIVPKVQYPRVWEEFNRLLAGGLPKYFENPILTKSGEERYIVWKNSEIRNNEQTVGTISFGIDITERKRAEDALRVSEEKFRLISESSPDHIVIQDRDLRYIWILNPQLGLTPEDMIGKTDYDILLKEDADQLTLVKRQVLETGKTIHYETSLSSSLGETEYFEGVYLPKYDNDGQIDGLMGYFRNITERKQAEQTIRHALAEKEVLLREVHHRVKNNLAGILALIELQISSLSDPQQIAQFKDLEKRIRSMALVHDSLSRTKDLARINVASYTENLTSHLLPAYGTEGKVRCRIEMGDITLPIETATPCGLVMTEIVTNSLKYAFPKTFSCEEIRGEPCTISLTLHRDGNDYLLGIADNGIGMPEGIDVTKPHTLGRFLIRFIVEHQLGGSIEISTARGTAYMIRFPAPAVTEGNTYEKM